MLDHAQHRSEGTTEVKLAAQAHPTTQVPHRLLDQLVMLQEVAISRSEM